MNKMKLFLLLVIAAVFHVDHVVAQTAAVSKNETTESKMKTYAATITADELKEHLQILAADEFEGRETGEPGQKKAAQYIANYYESLGAKPTVEGSWFQQYPLKKVSYLKSFADDGMKKYEMIKDFYMFHSEEELFDAKEIVFVGYGIQTKKYDDYKKADVKGKTVMCLMGEPTGKNGKSLITGDESYSEWTMEPSLKEDLAKELGAKNIIMVNMNYDAYMERVRYWLEQAPMTLDNPKRPQEEDSGLPLVFVSPTMANKILEKSGTTVEKATLKKLKKPVSVSGSLVFHMKQESTKLTAENVLCFIEGTDPILKNEIVVISAHYDHIGIVKGQINNGADDDGSGTVTSLELAEAFMNAKKEGNGTRRSILILNVSGEEKGLLGSEWYADFPVYPLENTVCDLNIDMIGRKDAQHPDEKYVYIIGSDKLSSDLHKISESCNQKYTNLSLDYTYNDPNDPNRFYYRSDHYNFAKNNIPVIFYFSGVHEDYHKPGDDVEKILFAKMETIGKLIFYTAWEVANRDERLKVDVKNVFGDE